MVDDRGRHICPFQAAERSVIVIRLRLAKDESDVGGRAHERGASVLEVAQHLRRSAIDERHAAEVDGLGAGQLVVDPSQLGAVVSHQLAVHPEP